MPFKSKVQAKFMFAKKPALAKEFASKTPDMKALPEHKEMKPHHSGKGTRARLNTAAEKHFFNSKYSK